MLANLLEISIGLFNGGMLFHIENIFMISICDCGPVVGDIFAFECNKFSQKYIWLSLIYATKSMTISYLQAWYNRVL